MVESSKPFKLHMGPTASFVIFHPHKAHVCSVMFWAQFNLCLLFHNSLFFISDNKYHLILTFKKIFFFYFVLFFFFDFSTTNKSDYRKKTRKNQCDKVSSIFTFHGIYLHCRILIIMMVYI